MRVALQDARAAPPAGGSAGGRSWSPVPGHVRRRVAAPGRDPRGCRRRPRDRPRCARGRAPRHAATSASSDSCWWVVLAGWITSVRTSPMLARWLHSSTDSMKRRPASRRRATPNENTAPGPERQVALGPLVVGMVGQAGPAHPRHRRVGAEELGDGAGVGDVGVHPLRQRLHALQQQEGVERRQRRADVAQLLGAQPRAEGVLAEVAPPRQPAVRRHRLGHPREVAVAPVEAAGLDDHPAERRAVAAEELRRRVHDDVGAPLDRPAQVRRGDGGVDHERDAGVVGDGGQALEVGDGAGRVGDDLGVDQPWCAACTAAANAVGSPTRRRTSSRTPKRAERALEQRAGAAVELGRRDDVVAGPAQRGERRGTRPTARWPSPPRRCRPRGWPSAPRTRPRSGWRSGCRCCRTSAGRTGRRRRRCPRTRSWSSGRSARPAPRSGRDGRRRGSPGCGTPTAGLPYPRGKATAAAPAPPDPVGARPTRRSVGGAGGGGRPLACGGAAPRNSPDERTE